MQSLTKFSMKNISAMFIIMLILFSAGIYTAGKLQVESMPDVSFPVVVVTTTYTGAPKDVMDNVTKPLEEKFANLADLDSMSSTSSDNYSFILLQFKQDVDIDKKKQDVEDAISQVDLPDTAQQPRASTFGASSFASNYLVLYADNGMSQTELDKYYKDTIKPGLESLPGFDHMDVVGARDTSLNIELNADALNVYGLSTAQVSGAIQAAVLKTPIGSVELNGNDKMVRVTGNIQSTYDLEQLEISTPSGDIVKLSQVADIKAITESDFIGRIDGKPAIGLILYKTSNMNAVEFSDALKDQIGKWEKELPNITFRSTYDSSDQIQDSIHGLLREGLVGALLAALMILLFLRHIRMTLIVLVSLPLSIVITLMLMEVFHLTLNSMTLGGMFIAIGRVVDDSIVVIENIYASLVRAQKRSESVIVLATKQVSMAITSSTLATVGVFAPIGMLSGVVGGFFRPFALTIAVALLSSLLVALTVIPMLAKLLVLGDNKAHHETFADGRFVRFYESVLTWCLKHRIKSLLLTALVFILTLVATVPNLKVSFLPSSNEAHSMYFQIKMPHETSFDATDNKTKQIENALSAQKTPDGQPVFEYVEALVGYAGNDDEKTPYASQIYLEVNHKLDPAKVKNEVKTYMESELPAGSSVDVHSIEGDFAFSSTDFSYSLQGDDQMLLEKAAQMVKEKLKTFPELSEIEDSLSDAKTEIEIIVDPVKARAYGLNASSVMNAARTWIQKQSLGDLRINNVTYKTEVTVSEEYKNSLEKLGNIPLTSANGSTVYLKEVAKVNEQPSATALQRDDGKQHVEVTAKINSPDKNRVSMKVTMALMQLELPEGVTPKVGGVSQDINESFSQLFLAMAVAVAMVYLIMVLAFGNAAAPFAILFSLPLAAIGGLIGLVITGATLDVTSMIGFLMLIGIVVTNAIVLIDRAQQLREEGHAVKEALVLAGKVRMRPIIMTAGATIMALLPLAMGLSGEGGLIGEGLGIVVIGGLFTSTILTLVVVPIAYDLLDGFKRRVSRLFRRKPSQAEPTQASV